MQLSVRMPTPVHEFFTVSITEEISKQLEVISHRGDSAAEFASRIANGGSARIFLKEDCPGGDARGTTVFHRREPDAQFQHRDAEYPGVVLEISYSQDGKDLKKLAWDYIQYSNGDIKVVIGIDIKYSDTNEATLSVWQPRYIHEDGEELDILEAEETTVSQVCHVLYRIGLKLIARSHSAPLTDLTTIRPTFSFFVSTISLRMKYQKKWTSRTRQKYPYHTKSLRSSLTRLSRCKSRENPHKGADVKVLSRRERHGSESVLQLRSTSSGLKMRQSSLTRR